MLAKVLCILLLILELEMYHHCMETGGSYLSDVLTHVLNDHLISSDGLHGKQAPLVDPAASKTKPLLTVLQKRMEKIRCNEDLIKKFTKRAGSQINVYMEFQPGACQQKMQV